MKAVQKENIGIREAGPGSQPTHLLPIFGREVTMYMAGITKEEQMGHPSFKNHSLVNLLTQPDPDLVAQQDPVLITHFVRAAFKMQNAQSLSLLKTPFTIPVLNLRRKGFMRSRDVHG